MSQTAESVVHTKKLLNIDDQTFRSKFNRSEFVVTHQLSHHPLFEFGNLFELVRAGRSKVYWDMGDIKVNQRWNETPAKSLSLEEALQQIEKAQAWMIFRSIQRNPEYRELLDAYLSEMEERSGIDFKKDVKVKDAILFVSSPRRIATYHIDRECSFLLQIRGDKVIYVFDKEDRAITTEEELETYWSVDSNAASYKEQYQHRAQEYPLTPGNGVHIPTGAPHWVKNGDNVSISLNLNVHFHDFLKANIYRANYYIRKAGLRPTPPGASKVKDILKRTVVGGAIAARKLMRGQPVPPVYSGNGRQEPPWK